MLWELFQTSRIEQANWHALDARFAAKEAQVDSRQLQHKVRVLEQQAERLTLAAMAMAELLRDRLGVAESEINAKIAEIDLRDGTLDGRLRAGTATCDKCQRPNAATRRNCLYCGHELASEAFLFPSEGNPDIEPPPVGPSFD